MRDKLPERKEIDLTAQTCGNHVFIINLWCPTYHGVKNEDVYVTKPTFKVRAMNFNDASEKASLMATVIGLCNDIWLSEIEGVSKV